MPGCTAGAADIRDKDGARCSASGLPTCLAEQPPRYHRSFRCSFAPRFGGRDGEHDRRRLRASNGSTARSRIRFPVWLSFAEVGAGNKRWWRHEIHGNGWRLVTVLRPGRLPAPPVATTVLLQHEPGHTRWENVEDATRTAATPIDGSDRLTTGSTRHAGRTISRYGSGPG